MPIARNGHVPTATDTSGKCGSRGDWLHKKARPGSGGGAKGDGGATGTLDPGPTGLIAQPICGTWHGPSSLSRVPFSQHCLKIDNECLFEERICHAHVKSGGFNPSAPAL